MSRVTVCHDGGCPLCRREIALVRRVDRRGRIDVVDVAGTATCPLDRAEGAGGLPASGRRRRAAARRRVELPEPISAFAILRDHVAFYAGPLDRCAVSMGW